MVELSGNDGNAFMILGLCQKAARRAALSETDIQSFTEEATKSDYDHLIKTALSWFNCT
jgi:hypothetical protein